MKNEKVEVKVTQLCLTFCDPMDYTMHGILQARIMEWVAVPFSKGCCQLQDRTQVSRTAGRCFTNWATREAQEYWSGQPIPSPGDLPDPELNWGLLCCRWILYQMSYQASPRDLLWDCKFHHKTAAIQSDLRLHIFNSGSLAISTTTAVTSSTDVLNLSKSSMRNGIIFFQTPAHVNILYSNYESPMFLTASRLIPFQRFWTDYAQIHQRNHYLWHLCYEIYFLNGNTWNYSLIRLGVVLVGMKICISLYISIRAFGRPGALSMSSSILNGIFL